MKTLHKIVLVLLMGAILATTTIITFDYAYRVGFDYGLSTSINAFETATGIRVTIIRDGDVYTFKFSQNGMTTSFHLTLHLIAEQWRNNQLISITNHPMNITTFGFNWLADNIAKTGGDNVSKFAQYVACSNASDAVALNWVKIVDEITTDGLERAQGTYQDTGAGTWNLNYTWTVTGTNATKLYGLYIDSYANWANGGLVAAEQQGAGSQKNLVADDTLKICIQGSLSQA